MISAGAGVRRRGAAVHLERGRPTELRRGRPGDAASGRGARARQGGRAPAQARPWRAARRGVRRPAAAARARALRRLRAQPVDPGRPRAAVDAGLRRPRRRGRAGPGLPVPPHDGAPAPAAPAAANPRRPGRRGRAAPARPVDGVHRATPSRSSAAEWRRHRREVRRLHEKLFYRPLLNAVAKLEADEARLSPEAALDRLEALGYADPEAALRHIEALTAGVTRRASIQRTLLPGDARVVRRAPRPRRGAAWLPAGERRARDDAVVPAAAARRQRRRRADGAGAGLQPLRHRPAAACAGGRTAARRRRRAAAPTGGGAGHRDAGRGRAPGRPDGGDRGGPGRAPARAVPGRLGGPRRACSTSTRSGEALSDIAAATLHGGLAAAVRAVERQRGSALPTRLLVVGMGRLGGHELGYGSDADVLFVHDPLEGADEREAHEAALAVVGELRRLLALPAPDPPMLVDADLRPEGRQGPLIRTLASYAAYYERWSLVWEAQALLRADPVVGDPGLAAGVPGADRPDPLAGGRVCRRSTSARSAGSRRASRRSGCRAAPMPTLHTKLGRGGLSDVEWTVQLLQLRHAAEIPGLRTTRTLAALEVAASAGLVEPSRRRRAGRGLAHGDPGPQRHDARARAAPPTHCLPTSASWRGWPASSVTLRAGQVTWWRTTDAPPGGPGGSWKECSTRERWRGTRPVAPASGLRPSRGPRAPGRRGVLRPR